MPRLAALLLLAACSPHITSHTPDHPGGASSGLDRAPAAMVDAPGTASGHGFNYSTDREQPFR